MRHLAYPNVRHGAFQGCGRYISCLTASPLPPCYTPAAPRLGNLAVVRTAITRLAPEWATYRATAQVYETRDGEDIYQGDSLALAYLLACIRCVRPCAGTIYTLPGDVWCTGALALLDGQPFLQEVDFTGFDVKLSTFITQAQDRLFLVPAVNIAQEHYTLCRTHQVHILTLPEFATVLRTLPYLDDHDDKFVVAIEGTELPFLVQTLFQRPARMAQGSLALLLGLLMTLGLPGGCAESWPGAWFARQTMQSPLWQALRRPGDGENTRVGLGRVSTGDVRCGGDFMPTLEQQLSRSAFQVTAPDYRTQAP